MRATECGNQPLQSCGVEKKSMKTLPVPDVAKEQMSLPPGAHPDEQALRDKLMVSGLSPALRVGTGTQNRAGRKERP